MSLTTTRSSLAGIIHTYIHTYIARYIHKQHWKWSSWFTTRTLTYVPMYIQNIHTYVHGVLRLTLITVHYCFHVDSDSVTGARTHVHMYVRTVPPRAYYHQKLHYSLNLPHTLRRPSSHALTMCMLSHACQWLAWVETTAQSNQRKKHNSRTCLWVHSLSFHCDSFCSSCWLSNLDSSSCLSGKANGSGNANNNGKVWIYVHKYIHSYTCIVCTYMYCTCTYVHTCVGLSVHTRTAACDNVCLHSIFPWYTCLQHANSCVRHALEKNHLLWVQTLPSSSGYRTQHLL